MNRTLPAITSAEIKDIAEAAADEAVRKMLLALGVDVKDVIETQKDMAYLRTWRVGTQKVGWKAVVTIVSIAVGGIVSAAVIGFKSLLGHGH